MASTVFGENDPRELFSLFRCEFGIFTMSNGARSQGIHTAFIVAINPAVNAGSICAVLVRKRFDGGASQPFLNSFNPDGFSYFVGYFATVDSASWMPLLLRRL